MSQANPEILWIHAHVLKNSLKVKKLIISAESFLNKLGEKDQNESTWH